jgi:F-type H+-transporting ATPase subunit epsilon
MQVQLITPETTVFTGIASAVSVPGTEGDFGVLPGHMPFISTIRPGIITIEIEGEVRKIGVKSGIAEITPEHCNILTETALDISAYTANDAQAGLQTAKAALAAAEEESARKEAALNLALAEAICLTF